tara:strand:+ start:235 stop:1284 length:1050 start_codon:yes stop_codon:yes gene_type:complete
MATKLGYNTSKGYGLSYSRLGTLHSCPRKFEIENVLGYREQRQSVTFAYGHMVGAGIQEVLDHNDITKAIFNASLEWDMPDIMTLGSGQEIKVKKSFWDAVEMIEKFHAVVNSPYNSELRDLLVVDGYQVADLETDSGVMKRGIEIDFQVKLNDGYTYEGHIDLLMFSPKLNKYLIVELKTTGFVNLHGSMYGNSEQALSYAVVLDAITRKTGASSSYKIVYIVATTQRKEFTVFPFIKTNSMRAEWITAVQLDAFMIEAYRATGLPFPARGGDCYNFGRTCEYYGSCHGKNSNFKPLNKNQESFEETIPDFTFDVNDLIDAVQYNINNRHSVIASDRPDDEHYDVEII